MKNRDLKKQLAAAIAMTIVATVALGSSTYAWFVSNANVTATGAKLTATGASSLLIAQNVKGISDDKQWKTTIGLEGAEENLVPASTIGTPAMKFYTANTFDTASSNGEYAAQTFNELTLTEASTDDGVVMDTFHIKSSSKCDLQLNTQTQFTIGTENTSILDQTLRLALVVTGNNLETPEVFIYQINNEDGGIKADTTLTGDGSVTGIINAIGKEAGDTVIADKISASNIKDEKGVPALKDHRVQADKDSITGVESSNADVLYHFDDTSAQGSDECTITAYIWMEGCDEQCNPDNSSTLLGSQNLITGTLGFSATNIVTSTTTP